MTRIPGTILLFDVDGTLTESRKDIKPEMYDFITNQVRPVVAIGLVGGAPFWQIAEQMRDEKFLDKFDYVFAENGTTAYQQETLIGLQSIQEHLGEEKLQRFINFALGYMSRLELPAKRGTFIEFRNGSFNICPVGKSCSDADRQQFRAFDKIHNIRYSFVQALNKEFARTGTKLKCLIGGQISFDVFPIGWDKTYCLQYLTQYPVIHFFGDRVLPGENDHEIFTYPGVIGHHVKSPEDTVAKVKELVMNLSNKNI